MLLVGNVKLNLKILQLSMINILLYTNIKKTVFMKIPKDIYRLTNF